MSKSNGLEKLQQEQAAEWKLLRARLATLADSLEHEASPAKWVGEHPYIATASAAVAGFAAAQITRKKPAAPPPAPAPPAPAASRTADLIAMAVSIAQHFMQPREPSAPATLRPGDGGSVVGAEFPAS